MLRSAVLAMCAVAAFEGAAHADDTWKRERAWFEWSTWIRVGYGVSSQELDTVPRSVTPQPRTDQTAGWQGALGAEMTLPIPTPNVRIGAWGELRGLDAFTGVELQVARSPRDLDWFFYSGEGAWTVRAGASGSHVTGSIAWGYRCPWTMYSPAPTGTRYMIGGRVVATATRAVANPNDWSMSLGIEFEPIGTIRYVFGIRNWYR